MPFSKDFDKVQQAVVRSVSAGGWLIVRADEIARPRRITKAILQAILTSDLVVADITGNNPNVFYELGFARATGCDIVMLCQKSAGHLPFDVAQDRNGILQNGRRWAKGLEQELRSLAMLA